MNKVTVGKITCVASEGADATKVAEASKGLSIKVSVGGKVFSATDEAISSHELSKNAGEEIIVTLSYSEDSALVDGDFDVLIGDIILEYNSAD